MARQIVVGEEKGDAPAQLAGAVDDEDEEWEDRPEEYGIQADKTVAAVASVKGRGMDESATSGARPAKFARLDHRGTTVLANPWAVLEVPQGSEAQEERVAETPVAEKPAEEERPRLPGKLGGWASADQVVEALQAVGMPGTITKREDIRVRIQPAQGGAKPQYVVYYYPTTRAILAQGKIAETVRARLAGWQAGRAQ